jgi:hypothetical protein
MSQAGFGNIQVEIFFQISVFHISKHEHRLERIKMRR